MLLYFTYTSYDLYIHYGSLCHSLTEPTHNGQKEQAEGYVCTTWHLNIGNPADPVGVQRYLGGRTCVMLLYNGVSTVERLS